MTATRGGARRDAPRARARRADGPRGVNPQVGAVILSPAGDVLAEGWHRGAGTAARRGRRAVASSPPGDARGATAVVTLEPATTPAAPARARRRSSPPASRASSTRSPTPAQRSAGGAERLRDAGVEVEAGRARRRGDRRCSRPGSTVAAARPPARHREVGAEPRRPRRGSRRHQPVDHRHRPRAPTCTAAAPRPTRSSSAPAPCSPTTPRSPRAAPTARCYDAPADPGRARRARRCPADAALRSHPHGPLLVRRRATSPAVLADLRRARHPARLRRGRPDARERVPRAPASSTRCSPTSRRCCSAATGSRSATSASPRSATRGASQSHRVERLGDDLLDRRPRPAPHRRELTDVHRNHRRDRRGHRRRADRATACASPCARRSAVSDAAHGDSISVSGVCLTVVDHGDDWFTADVMAQTLDMSTLAGVAAGRAVNLERADGRHGRLGGHIVQGHIDGTGELLDVRPGDAVARAAHRPRPRTSRRSSSTRARSRSTASRSP